MYHPPVLSANKDDWVLGGTSAPKMTVVQLRMVRGGGKNSGGTITQPQSAASSKIQAHSAYPFHIPPSSISLEAGARLA